jgi:hypothetical protein
VCARAIEVESHAAVMQPEQLLSAQKPLCGDRRSNRHFDARIRPIIFIFITHPLSTRHTKKLIAFYQNGKRSLAELDRVLGGGVLLYPGAISVAVTA